VFFVFLIEDCGCLQANLIKSELEKFKAPPVKCINFRQYYKKTAFEILGNSVEEGKAMQN
jgi:hypothetical protein